MVKSSVYRSVIKNSDHIVEPLNPR